MTNAATMFGPEMIGSGNMPLRGKKAPTRWKMPESALEWPSLGVYPFTAGRRKIMLGTTVFGGAPECVYLHDLRANFVQKGFCLVNQARSSPSKSWTAGTIRQVLTRLRMQTREYVAMWRVALRNDFFFLRKLENGIAFLDGLIERCFFVFDIERNI